jgi:O-antigen chain-terminating methyltransferase
MRSVSTAARWMFRGSWAWITLEPGSRPRRMARKFVVAAVGFVLTRPLLARILKTLLERIPKLNRLILARLPVELVLALSVDSVSSSDALLSERERFVHARLTAALEKRLS